MQRLWSLIVFLFLLSCARDNKLNGLVADESNNERDGVCIDVEFKDLPISQGELFGEIERVTGYQRDEIEIQRLCKYEDSYLLGILPPIRGRHGINSLLLIIDNHGKVEASPSM